MPEESIDRRLADASAPWDLLKHPFYQRWAAGELSRESLTYYAGQYAHVVRAIPRWLDRAADVDAAHAETLRAHAKEEAAREALWDRFAATLGIEADALRAIPANAATATLIARCDALAASGSGAAVVWAIEAQSPAVSAEKLRGLRAFYGIDAGSGGEYFALHEALDVEHEAHLRTVIGEQPADVRDRAPAAVTEALSGMWGLLSAVA